MSTGHEGDGISSSDDEVMLTPSAKSASSGDIEEQPIWFFRGKVVDPPLENNACLYSSLALVVHQGRPFCLWTGERGGDSRLYWTSLDGHGRWDLAQEVSDLSAVFKRPVSAVGAPAIADLNGILHVVFDERPASSPSAPDGCSTLVHMQYDDQCHTWGKRASLGISTRSSIILKGHQAHLFCGYTSANQELQYSTWSEATGWSHATVVADSRCAGQALAFYNFGNSLHMLYAGGSGEKQTLYDLEHERTTWCWLPSRPPFRLEEPLFDGLDAVSCEGRIYVLHRNHSFQLVLTTTNFEGQCIAQEKIHDDASWTTPALAIVNGNLICIWVGGPRSQRELLWSHRPTAPSTSMKEWMSRIDSDEYLSELSIPGSHESCATIAIPWVQCQNTSIDDQLTSGVRYFDFRCGVSFGALYLFHGRSPLGFTLAEVLVRIYEWLTRVPTEALVVQIKMEGGTGDQAAFEELLRLEFTQNAIYWALGNAIPKLGAVRGKIQLMRRFDLSSATFGIDVRQWADNSPKFIIPLGQQDKMVVQDQYEYTDMVPTFAELVRTKSSAIDSLITAAKEDRNCKTWYLNWCNAYALPFSLGVVATPADIAIGRNDIVAGRRQFVPGVNASLSTKNFVAPGKGRYGTILLDFAATPDPGLVAAIVMTNTLK